MNDSERKSVAATSGARVLASFFVLVILAGCSSTKAELHLGARLALDDLHFQVRKEIREGQVPMALLPNLLARGHASQAGESLVLQLTRHNPGKVMFTDAGWTETVSMTLAALPEVGALEIVIGPDAPIIFYSAASAGFKRITCFGYPSSGKITLRRRSEGNYRIRVELSLDAKSPLGFKNACEALNFEGNFVVGPPKATRR